MKVAVLGANGMLGHKLIQVLANDHDVSGTCRKANSQLSALLNHSRIMSGFEVSNFSHFDQYLRTEKFDVVINCIGIIKQQKSSTNFVSSIETNSLFPHKIAAICAEIGSKFIHISTDCVFTGEKGFYTEQDIPDATDLYGKTKELGEVMQPSLTLRTSIIGHELKSNISLLNWFLTQDNVVKGYTNAIYSGIPTVHLAKVIKSIIVEKLDKSGLYQIASQPISKFDLLSLVKNVYRKEIRIDPYEEFKTNKSLDGSKFTSDFSILVPSWDYLLLEMYDDFVQNKFLYKDLFDRLYS